MTVPKITLTTTATPTDPRLGFLCVAASHYRLVDAGDETLDIGFAATTRLFDKLFPPAAPCCPTCGCAPCINPSFCASSRRANYKRGRR